MTLNTMYNLLPTKPAALAYIQSATVMNVRVAYVTVEYQAWLRDGSDPSRYGNRAFPCAAWLATYC